MADSSSGPTADPSDSARPPDPLVVRRSSSASTLGKRNIAVAVSLMLLGLSCGICLVVVGHGLQQVSRQVEQEKHQYVDELTKQIEQTEDEQKKTELQEELQRIAARHDLPKTDIIWNWCIVEVVSGLVLNLLLLFAGFRLMRRRPWGRRWSMATCGMKIVRLLALYLFFIVLMLREANTSRNAPVVDPASSWGEGVITLIGLAFAVSVMVVGMIYPFAMWKLLKEPKVAAECLSVSHSTNG